MCNACGFLCCGFDCFSECGCEHCPNPACWPAAGAEPDGRDNIRNDPDISPTVKRVMEKFWKRCDDLDRDALSRPDRKEETP